MEENTAKLRVKLRPTIFLVESENTVTSINTILVLFTMVFLFRCVNSLISRIHDLSDFIISHVSKSFQGFDMKPNKQVTSNKIKTIVQCHSQTHYISWPLWTRARSTVRVRIKFRGRFMVRFGVRVR